MADDLAKRTRKAISKGENLTELSREWLESGRFDEFAEMATSTLPPYPMDMIYRRAIDPRCFKKS